MLLGCINHGQRIRDGCREPVRIANGKGIAAHFGVTPAAVSNWESRNADYPAPLDLPDVHGIPLWDLADIIAWRMARD